MKAQAYLLQVTDVVGTQGLRRDGDRSNTIHRQAATSTEGFLHLGPTPLLTLQRSITPDLPLTLLPKVGSIDSFIAFLFTV